MTEVTGHVEWTVDGYYTRFGTLETLVEVSKKGSREKAEEESSKIAEASVKLKILGEFVNKMKEQKVLPAKYAKALKDHFWEII